MDQLVPQVRVAEQRLPRIDVDDAARRRAGSRRGWFIQALTEITISEPVNPAITIGIPQRKCVRGDRRSQP